MESVARVKKCLRAPIRKLSVCVSAVANRKLREKRRARPRRGKARGAVAKYPSVVRAYQADLDKERKLREAANAQKNAERAAMRAHFRRKYQLSQNGEDLGHLKRAGGKVTLPRELAKLVRPDAKGKDDGPDLLDALRGLRLDSRAPRRGRACQVM